MKNNRKNVGLFFILLSMGLVLSGFLFGKIGNSESDCNKDVFFDMILVISSFIIFIVGLLLCNSSNQEENYDSLDNKEKRKEHQNE
jgi:hypothetical protein